MAAPNPLRTTVCIQNKTQTHGHCEIHQGSKKRHRDGEPKEGIEGAITREGSPEGDTEGDTLTDTGPTVTSAGRRQPEPVSSATGGLEFTPDRLRELNINECAIYQGCLGGICDRKELVFAEEAGSFGGHGAESCYPV